MENIYFENQGEHTYLADRDGNLIAYLSRVGVSLKWSVFLANGNMIPDGYNLPRSAAVRLLDGLKHG